MKLEHLSYLCKITPGLSLNAQSKNIHISQQGLSAAIKCLEKEMGCALLLRTGKGVYFTEAGEKLVNCTKAYLEQVRQIRAEQNPLIGELFLPITPCIIPLYMGEIISRYMKENPQVVLDFAYSSSMEKCMNHLLQGEAEIAFGFNALVDGQPTTDILTQIETGGCEFHVCKTVVSCVECHKDFLPQDTPLYLRELSDKTCIAYLYNADNITDTRAMLTACGNTSELVHEYNKDLYYERLLSKMGYGLTMSYSGKVSHYRADELKQVQLKDDIRLECGYITQKGTELSLLAQRFIEMVSL